jgi:putative redox protein
MSVISVDKYLLIGSDGSGHSVIMDAPTAAGSYGSAVSPAKLLLLSLAGCTAMDVLMILRKEKQQVTRLEVKVSGDQATEFPHYFKEIRLKYVVQGRGVSEESLKRAIQLSDEKYCSVGATLKGRASIRYSHEILEDQ